MITLRAFVGWPRNSTLTSKTQRAMESKSGESKRPRLDDGENAKDSVYDYLIRKLNDADQREKELLKQVEEERKAKEVAEEDARLAKHDARLAHEDARLAHEDARLAHAVIGEAVGMARDMVGLARQNVLNVNQVQASGKRLIDYVDDGSSRTCVVVYFNRDDDAISANFIEGDNVEAMERHVNSLRYTKRSRVIKADGARETEELIRDIGTRMLKKRKIDSVL